MGEDDIYIIEPQPRKTLLRALDDATRQNSSVWMEYMEIGKLTVCETSLHHLVLDEVPRKVSL